MTDRWCLTNVGVVVKSAIVGTAYGTYYVKPIAVLWVERPELEPVKLNEFPSHPEKVA